MNSSIVHIYIYIKQGCASLLYHLCVHAQHDKVKLRASAKRAACLSIIISRN